jgi:hypothetical protein
MAQKLIKGSIEEKVYHDPGNLLLFINRNQLSFPQQQSLSLHRREHSSASRPKNVPALKLAEFPLKLCSGFFTESGLKR